MFATQVLCEVALVASAWWGFQSLGLWLPALAQLIAGHLILLLLGQRRPCWLSRPEVKRIAVSSAGVHAVLAGVGYALAYLKWPDAFAFEPSALWLLAPTLGVAAGAATLVLTLCAGDAARAALGISSD